MKKPNHKQNSHSVFDQSVLANNRKRAQAEMAKYDFLFAEVKARLDERLGEIKREFKKTAHMGYPELNIKFKANEGLGLKPKSYDLITNNLELHWVNDLPGVLSQLNQALIPDGLMLASLFGGDTLIELRSSLMEAEMETTNKAVMRTSPFADVRDLGGLMMRAGFALPVIDVDRIKISYKNMTSLMHDLRYMGEGNALTDRPTSLRRDTLAKAQEIYMTKFPHEDGKGICATFDVIFLTGWSADDSQPKPLKPGSASVSLADALKPKKNKL